MASSAVSSVIGSPLSEGSCFGFLSFAAAGIPALAGNSSVSEKTQEKESTAARIDLGVAEITGNFGEKVEAGWASRPLPTSPPTPPPTTPTLPPRQPLTPPPRTHPTHALPLPLSPPYP